MGATGTDRTMLDFQIRLNGKPIDPATVLSNN
jgi:lipoprotein NlpD